MQDTCAHTRLFLLLSAANSDPELCFPFCSVPAANSDAKLYDEELQQILAAHPDQFRLDYALSREGAKNKRGGKMYM